MRKQRPWKAQYLVRATQLLRSQDSSSPVLSQSHLSYSGVGVLLDCLRKTSQEISEWEKPWPCIWQKKTRVSICLVLFRLFDVPSHKSSHWSPQQPWDARLSSLTSRRRGNEWFAPIIQLINDSIGARPRSPFTWASAPTTEPQIISIENDERGLGAGRKSPSPKETGSCV